MFDDLSARLKKLTQAAETRISDRGSKRPTSTAPRGSDTAAVRPGRKRRRRDSSTDSRCPRRHRKDDSRKRQRRDSRDRRRPGPVRNDVDRWRSGPAPPNSERVGHGSVHDGRRPAPWQSQQGQYGSAQDDRRGTIASEFGKGKRHGESSYDPRQSRDRDAAGISAGAPWNKSSKAPAPWRGQDSWSSKDLPPNGDTRGVPADKVWRPYGRDLRDRATGRTADRDPHREANGRDHRNDWSGSRGSRAAKDYKSDRHSKESHAEAYPKSGGASGAAACGKATALTSTPRIASMPSAGQTAPPEGNKPAPMLKVVQDPASETVIGPSGKPVWNPQTMKVEEESAPDPDTVKVGPNGLPLFRPPTDQAPEKVGPNGLPLFRPDLHLAQIRQGRESSNGQ